MRVPIKLEMLRCFHAVTEHGSLAAAAVALDRTPSAVSMTLKQLEAHVGAPLFETGRKTRLTALGREVRDAAARELDHFERTVETITGLARAELGLVRVAATPSIVQSVLPDVLREFLSERPGVRVELADMDSAAVLDALRDERADLGLASLGQLPGLACTRLLADPFGVVCRADDALVLGSGSLSWDRIAVRPFIANGLCARIDAEGFAPIMAGARLMVRSTTSLLALIRAGLGVTVLPRLAVPPDATDLAFLPIEGLSSMREVWLATLPDHALTPTAAALAGAIRRTKFQMN